jgi:hypothetical protein
MPSRLAAEVNILVGKRCFREALYCPIQQRFMIALMDYLCDEVMVDGDGGLGCWILWLRFWREQCVNAGHMS